ncbi:helix-turn-helix domain-containing protein [Myroides odoratus]
MKKNVKLTSTEEILQTLKIKLGVKKEMDLAHILNVKANTLSSWKIRNSIPHATILKLCKQYNFDLNEIFYDNYININSARQYVNVPILYISNHLEYYFTTNAKLLNLHSLNLPEDIGFEWIIQVLEKNPLKKEILLPFYTCKKISIQELVIDQKYIFLVKDKGFVSGHLLNINDSLQMLETQSTTFKDGYLPVKDIIEIFHCIGTYKTI